MFSQVCNSKLLKHPYCTGGFKTVEFEFRVRVRVSSNFLPLTSTKTVELFNEMISFAYHY